MNKNTVGEFEKFLKRNATCGAYINVFVEGSDKALGVVIKKGNLFIPPSVCRASKFSPDVPSCYRFTMSDDELSSIELVGFNDIVYSYKNIINVEDRLAKVLLSETLLASPRIISTKQEE